MLASSPAVIRVRMFAEGLIQQYAFQFIQLSDFIRAAGDFALTESDFDQSHIVIHFPSVFKRALFFCLHREWGDYRQLACSLRVFPAAGY